MENTKHVATNYKLARSLTVFIITCTFTGITAVWQPETSSAGPL